MKQNREENFAAGKFHQSMVLQKKKHPELIRKYYGKMLTDFIIKPY